MMPKLGMHYDDVVKRVKRIQSYKMGDPQYKSNLIDSLKRQCRLAEGESAIKELERECASLNQKDSTLSGVGNKQISCCMKFECKNRNTKCNTCHKWNYYEP